MNQDHTQPTRIEEYVSKEKEKYYKRKIIYFCFWLTWRHTGHAPASVAPEHPRRTQSVGHGAEGRQTVRGQQRSWSSEHVRRLLALLPFGSSVLEPYLKQGKQ